MRKIAIFVEGQTELITIREFLLKEFKYEVSIECRTLFKPSELNKVPFDYSNPAATFHFQIIDVGNDNAVLKRILKRELNMWNAGYERIIGLRDMYSAAYREESQQIDDEVTRRFIEGTQATLQQKAQYPDKIIICFAVMEIESWFLAMYKVFQRLDERLTAEFIEEHTAIDLKNIDPEKEFFHPAREMEKIYQLVDMTYDKHKGDIESITGHLTAQDYADLLAINKCKKFNLFYHSLGILNDCNTS